MKIMCNSSKRLTYHTREIWIDNIKIIACVLVALGHFFHSIVDANILPESEMYKWFYQTIYCFHVPLFFICSGYLFQKFSKVVSIKSWGENIINKALALGIPYFIFSVITWALKSLFSEDVNNKAWGLLETLFLKPTSQYWYLYCLFFIYVITWTFCKRKTAIYMMGVAVIFKFINIFLLKDCIYLVTVVFANEVWFVLGMFLCKMEFQKVLANNKYYKTLRNIGIVIGVIFLLISILIYEAELNEEVIKFLLGILACISIIILVSIKSKKQNIVLEFIAKYTMPIFLLHTFFAALFRIVLLRLGIMNVWVHIVAGISASFLGPICVAIVAEKIWWLDFFFYPGRYIKIKIGSNQ